MKYTISYVENNDIITDGEEKDKYIKKTFECDDDLDALLCGLSLQLGDDFGDFMEDYADDEDFNEDFVKGYLKSGYAEDRCLCIVFWIKKGSKIIWESPRYTESNFERKKRG